MVAVCGIFTRITFGAFFLPVFLEVVKWSLRQSRFSLQSWTRLLTPSLAVAVIAASGFAYCDTAYFNSSFLELTPLNFLRYNLLPSNLAEHGLHPRWLHLVVNLPMIVTPPLLVYAFIAEWDVHSPRTQEKSVEMDKRKLGVIERMQNGECPDSLICLSLTFYSDVLVTLVQHHASFHPTPPRTSLLDTSRNADDLVCCEQWAYFTSGKAILGKEPLLCSTRSTTYALTRRSCRR